MLLANLALLAGRASRPEDAVNLAYTEEGPQRVVLPESELSRESKTYASVRLKLNDYIMSVE